MIWPKQMWAKVWGLLKIVVGTFHELFPSNTLKRLMWNELNLVLVFRYVHDLSVGKTWFLCCYVCFLLQIQCHFAKVNDKLGEQAGVISAVEVCEKKLNHRTVRHSATIRRWKFHIGLQIPPIFYLDAACDISRHHILLWWYLLISSGCFSRVERAVKILFKINKKQVKRKLTSTRFSKMVRRLLTWFVQKKYILIRSRIIVVIIFATSVVWNVLSVSYTTHHRGWGGYC